MMKIEDNFLDQEEFDKLQSILMGVEFSWFFNPFDVYENNKNEKEFLFTHIFYTFSFYQCHSHSCVIHFLYPILEKIKPISLLRIQANLLTKTSNIVESAYHHDISSFDDENRKTIFPEKLKQLTTSIFYVNTNNGYTKFEDGTKVESVANRMVSFPADLKHTGTSCTDEKIRVVINFNYFK